MSTSQRGDSAEFAKSFHSFLQGALDRLIHPWCRGNGRVGPEWAVVLKRKGFDWVPTPDVTYVSYARLPQGFRPEAMNEACPIPCDLVIEIIFPDQSRGELTQKAQDYLKAGVLRVWVIDPEIVDITVFFPDGTRSLYTSDTKIIDMLLPGLELSPQLIFEEAELL